ncbi:MurR/RpiR family transcriptional regulator [Brevibacillus migulae]|uniref:MurR/RpiR family transcriptional regulator n=1 Tax=Brevibacillus migulae TaxID=1644114 RepID=UPI00106DE77C|nr:MurR/RpiR family transcriptional regulator [Brevibacillus migulae]
MKSFAILEKIENHMEHFTQAEKKVAAYIMTHAELVPNMTTKDVSKHAGASEASVVRFCKTIGVSSFKAFKIALVRELTRSDSNISDFSVIQTQDAPYDLFQKVLYHNKTAIEELTTTLEKKELERAIEAILATKNIIFYGVGGSSSVSLDASHKFRKIGYHSDITTDYHMMLPILSNLAKGDVLVAISNSGSTREVLDVVRFAKKKEITIVAITSLMKSPLYKEADIRLCTPNIEPDFRIGSIASRIMQLTIIDTLFVSIFNRIGGSVIDKFNEVREEIVQSRR